MIEVMSRSRRSGGGISRRCILKAGILGWAGLSLPNYLRARAAASAGGGGAGDDVSVILIWLDGGPPQHETYDPKPDAPTEFRGPLKAIPTAVAGIQLPELMPYHARIMDKLALLRSVHHDNGDHFAAAHWMLTGYLGSNAANLSPQYPSAGSIITKIKGAKRPGIPAYIGLPHTHSVGISPGYHGGAYLGVATNPFTAEGDPNQAKYEVPNLSLPAGVNTGRFGDRRALLTAFDQARRETDGSGLMDGLDRFTQDAYEMLSGPAARAAFDLSKEDPRLRDRYGRNQLGQCTLLARRLVEAGARFVTVTNSGWDVHSSLDNSMHHKLPILDSMVGSLVDDLDQRGMLSTTIVMVMGEFGRTPRMNTGGVPGADPVPGRDHWGNVMSVLMAGGGIAGGRTIGSSNARGEVPRDRPLAPQDVLATLYQRLGIPGGTSFIDRAGRPISVGSNGKVIEELFA